MKTDEKYVTVQEVTSIKPVPSWEDHLENIRKTFAEFKNAINEAKENGIEVRFSITNNFEETVFVSEVSVWFPKREIINEDAQ